jgi:hypothetical protein
MQELGLKPMGNFAKKNGEKCHNASGGVLSYVAAYNKQSINFCKHKTIHKFTWRERSI